MDVLIHISQQLSNSSTTAYSPTEFTVSPSISAVNVLFFLSLALVLIDAFLAMLVKSWLQEFDRGWRKYTVANLRAQERERRLQGLERWKLAELVALLPILIQTSLLLFCIGLLGLLFPIHLISAIVSSLALVTGLTFYISTTYMSIFDSYAPFSSPVSRGLIISINALQTAWIALVSLISRNVRHIISIASFHISRPLPPQEDEANTDPSTQLVPEKSKVAHLSRGNAGVENREAVARSHFQINPQTYVDVLERLVMTTAEAVENLPVFLELLDQPVKDLSLRPSNVEKWKDLLSTTLGLLGDPSTFSDSVARIIARNVLFCYDGQSSDQQLCQRLRYHFDHICSGQTGKHEPLNSLFAPYLRYYYGFSLQTGKTFSNIIASLEPSNAADAELLWMVNTIHKHQLWSGHPLLQSLSLSFFAAVLTYVSSSEQSRRSQVPLTAAVIHAMHTIKLTLETGGIHSIDGPYILPGAVLTNPASMSMTFHQVDGLDLWSDRCVEFASSLLQPHTRWFGFGVNRILKFQLALISALYIDSTKQAGNASAAFTKLLGLINIPNMKKNTWGWADAYDQSKLAGYWYMALFQEPIYQENSHRSALEDIGYVIIQTIDHCAEIRLPALHLLETSIKHLSAIASSPSNLLTRDEDGDLCLAWTGPDGPVTHYSYQPFNPWILLHLETLFSQSSLLHQGELEQLEWTDTPEQVHIAMARLALYDSLQGEGHKETNWLKPDPGPLSLFLWSKDYVVCTGAFKCCLNLATISQPSSTGDIHSAEMFIPETMGSQWIKHLIQVLFSASEYGIVRSWKFLVEHLIPKWATLPPSWCHKFALVFLLSTVHVPDMDELPAYQLFAETFRTQAMDMQVSHAFLSFLEDMLGPIVANSSLNWHQVTFLEMWLAQLPGSLEKEDAHIKLGNHLAVIKQQIVDETLRFFAELPMAYSE